MKCISCDVEINPQWAHAIDINVCPFCGKHIMEEHLKNLFGTLRETMNALSTYPDQVNDWMLSNHNYIKADAENIKSLLKLESDKDFQKKKDAQKFSVKVKKDNGEEEEVLAEALQSEEETNDFFKRAEVIKKSSAQSPIEKTQQLKAMHLKAMAEKIKTAGLDVPKNASNSHNIPEHMIVDADPEAVTEYYQMISGTDPAYSNSSIDESLEDLPGGEASLQANIRAASSKNNGSGTYSAKDMAMLQKLQSKSVEARKNVQSGAKGSFSRS